MALSLAQAQETLHLLGVPRLVGSEAASHRHALRMAQTPPSILPNCLIMKIIKEADGGRSTHKLKFKAVLANITQMEPVGCGEPQFANLYESPWEGSEEAWTNFPVIFPPVSMCTHASGLMRYRELTDLEVERIDWWDGGGGCEGMPQEVLTGERDIYDTNWYQHRFQTYLFH